MSDRDDLALIRASRDDARAFGELYVRHAVVIHGWFRRRVAEPAATDLTAETFAAAWAGRRRFQPERADAVTPWLYGIAQNQYRMYLRHLRVETSARVKLGMGLLYPSALESDEADDRLSAAQAQPSLEDALGRLSEAQRTAVELRVIDDLTFAEIAARMGSTEPAARVRVMRALRTVRTAITKRGGAA
jgi:RNA polymerase sigma factor (sigma-70 family)